MNENNLNNVGVTPTPVQPVQPNVAPTPAVAPVAPVEPVVSAPINNVAETVTPTPNGKKSNRCNSISISFNWSMCIWIIYLY